MTAFFAHRNLISMLKWAILCCIFLCTKAYAQNLQLSRNYTMADGLPSNHIYSCVQDNKGFLWIGSDNGVVRFDGKYFRTFSAKDGVTDNDILEIHKEKDGTIWINSYKDGPSYYDEKLNVFVNPLKNENVNRDIIKLVLWVKPLEEGGIVFYKDDKEFLFKNRKLVRNSVLSAFKYKDSGSENLFYSKYGSYNGIHGVYAFSRNGNKYDSTLIINTSGKDPRRIISHLFGNKLYLLLGSGKIFVIKKTTVADAFSIDSITIGKPVTLMRWQKNQLNVTAEDGSILCYDNNTLHLKYEMSGDYFGNCLYADNEGNVWVGTSDRGLLLFKKNDIRAIYKNNESRAGNNFRSVYADGSGIYGGSFYGEILQNKQNKISVRNVVPGKTNTRILEMITSQNKLFVFSEIGCLVNFGKNIKINNSEPLLRLKCAFALNDSIIVSGGVRNGGALYKINTKTENAELLNCPVMRISAIVRQGDDFYIGSNDGVFKYNYSTNTTRDVFKNSPIQGERILSMTTTPDGLLWIATVSKGIAVCKNDKVIKMLYSSVIYNNSPTVIVTDEKGRIWTGSRSGISRIYYTLKDTVFGFNTQNLSVIDGMPGNIVNDLHYYKDSIYAATENGIAVVSVNFSAPQNDIKTYLTEIKVNQNSRTVADRYELKSNEHSVALTFSAISLTGYVKNLQYRVNEYGLWTDLQGNTLNIELESGSHTIYVRAVDVNNKPSHHVLAIMFAVSAPFYQKTGFIVLCAILLTALFFIGYNRYKLQRQKRALNQKIQIERERNRITADLHDDIGSSLSSLQFYSDAAGKLIEKDKERAKSLLVQISDTSAKILENIGDIIWSLRSDRENVMPLTARIKNFVSELLGSAEIAYHINIDESIDAHIQNIVARKNIMLFVKEAVNNVFKYSGASKIFITLGFVKDDLVINIKDDGKGMNLTSVKNTGNGLSNMRKRVQELGGTFNIRSTPNNGTEVSAQIPVVKIRDTKL